MDHVLLMVFQFEKYLGVSCPLKLTLSSMKGEWMPTRFNTGGVNVFFSEMSLDNSQFQDITIDIDSILFSLSEVQDVAKKYLEPEPYQGSKEPSQTGSLWQNLGGFRKYFS